MNKICKKCNSSLPITEFYKSATTKDRLMIKCKKCHYKSMRALVLANPEYHRHYQKVYSINNRERLKKISKKYRETIKHNPSYIIGSRYNLMKSRVNGTSTHKSSAFGKQLCTKEEYLDWCNKTQKDFTRIYNFWLKSGCKLKFTPTVDRINNNIGYIPENMQWLSQSDNRKKENAFTKVLHY
jgi:ribosomal protein L40E